MFFPQQYTKFVSRMFHESPKIKRSLWVVFVFGDCLLGGQRNNRGKGGFWSMGEAAIRIIN